MTAEWQIESRQIESEGLVDSFWWAVYTRHQHEKTVARLLSGKGIEVFLPLYDSRRRWKDRAKLLSLPLFPCYLFVRGGADWRLPILSTPGVHALLTFGDVIARVPEREIQAIRRSVESPLPVQPHPFIERGIRVRVTRGALEGLEGVFVRTKSQHRLVLSVDLLAQSVGVEISASDVEPIAA